MTGPAPSLDADWAMDEGDIRKYPAYPSYKPSGVDWLGNIPSHWKIKRLKYLCMAESGATPPTNQSEYWGGDIPWVSPKDMKRRVIEQTEDYVTSLAIKDGFCRTLLPGTVLIVVRSGILRHTLPVSIAACPVTINQDIRALKTNSSTTNSYLAWIIEGNQRALLELWTKPGTTVESIESEYLMNGRLSVPSIAEQQTIAHFLDDKTMEIDALIAAKRELLALLKEKRQAVITHAVTKGLDPNFKLKPSGIEWLGDVPEHWEINRLNRVCSLITDGSHISPDLSSPDFPFVSTVDIKNGNIDFENCLSTSKKSYEYLVRTGCRPKKGDILFSKDGTIGKTCSISNEKNFVVASSLVIISPKHNIIFSDYLEYWLNNILLRQNMMLQISGAALRRISVEKVCRLPMVFPSYQEQKHICSHLDAETKQIYYLASEVETAITTLQEYRTALISAAVTGKIDVRNEVDHAAA